MDYITQIEDVFGIAAVIPVPDGNDGCMRWIERFLIHGSSRILLYKS